MIKNTNKKGELLVETIVAMTIAALMTIAFFGVFKSFSSVGKRQEEYIFFEGVCDDIDKYYDAYGKDMWDDMYFKKEIKEGERVFVKELGTRVYIQEYFDNFELLETPQIPNDTSTLKPIYTYLLTYDINDKDELVVNIKNVETGKDVIKNLNYGKSNATDTGGYYNQVQTKNPQVYNILNWKDE